MLKLESILKKLIAIFIVLLAVALVVIYKKYKFQKAENIRQTKNNIELRKSDSLRFTSQILTSQEIQEYLNYQNKDLKKYLEENQIKTNRIETIITQKIIFRDSIVKEYFTTDKELIFTDSTNCLTINGIASVKNDTLSVRIQNREFNNKSDGVAYWQRREWNFLGFKTRLLGKKEFTAVQFDECGKSQVLKIEKKQ